MAAGKITVATIRAARATKALRHIRKLHKSVKNLGDVAKAKRANASLKALDAQKAKEFTQAARAREMVATEKFRQTKVLASAARQDFIHMDQVLTHAHGRDIPQIARLALEAEGKVAANAAKAAAEAEAELLAIQQEVRVATRLETAAQADAVLADQISVEADLVLRDVEMEFANAVRRGGIFGVAAAAVTPGEAQAASQEASLSTSDVLWELVNFTPIPGFAEAEDFAIQNVIAPVIVESMDYVVDPVVEEAVNQVTHVAAAVTAKASLDEAFKNQDEAQIEKSLIRSNSKEAVWDQAAGAPRLNPTANTPGVQLP